MSWDVYLDDRSQPPTPTCDEQCAWCDERCVRYPTLQVEGHEEGGTYALGGTTDADLNITYNYSLLFRWAFSGSMDDIETGLTEALDDKRAGDTLPLLLKAIERLTPNETLTGRTDDYWAPTPANAAYALSILAKWAEQHPDGVWCVR